MTILLNNTGNPITREERIKINENWNRIVEGLTAMQLQINMLAGTDEVQGILNAINTALERIEQAQTKVDIALIKAESAVTMANESASKADASAIKAEEEAENAFNATQDAIQATNSVNTAIQEVNTAIANLDALKLEVTSAISKANLATQDANQATENANQSVITLQSTINAAIETMNTTISEKLVDSTNKINLLITESTGKIDTAVLEANSASLVAREASENIKGWTTAEEWQTGKQYVTNNVVTFNGSTWQVLTTNVNSQPSVSNEKWILLAQRGVDGTGSVSSVNGQFPDTDGNVQLELGAGTVKSVNSKLPDSKGNVLLNVGITRVNGSTGGLTGVVTLDADDVGAETPTGAQEKVDTIKKHFVDRGFGAKNTEIRRITNYTELAAITESGIYLFRETGVGGLGLPTVGSEYILYVTAGAETVTTATYLSVLAVELGSQDIATRSGKIYTKTILKRSNGNTNNGQWETVGDGSPTEFTNEEVFLYNDASEGGIYTVISESPSEFFPKDNTWYTVWLSVYEFGAEKHYSYVAVEGNTQDKSDATGRVMSRFIIAEGGTTTDDSGWSEGGGGGVGTKSFFVPYVLPTTIVDQKTWDLPADSYDAAIDSLVVFHNTVYLAPTSYTITGKVGAYKINIPDNPHSAIADNNLTVLVLKNVPEGLEHISGTLLTDGSVSLSKLGQDVKDALGNGGAYKIIPAVAPITLPDNAVFTEGTTVFSSFNTGSFVADWIATLGLNRPNDANGAVIETVKDLKNPSKVLQEVTVYLGSVLVGRFARISSGMSAWGAWKRLTFDIVNDPTTGGADKVASAESVKMLNNAMANKVDRSALDTANVVLQLHTQGVATTEKLGHIKPDGITFTVDPITGIAKSLAKGFEVNSYTGDLNSLTETGVYQGIMTANTPAGLTGTKCIVEVFNLDNSVVEQILHFVGNNLGISLWRRVSVSSSWGAWVRIENVLSSSITSNSTTDGANSNAVNQLNNLKANKLLTNNTELTLNVGWSHASDSLSAPLTYYKDDFGIVHLQGTIRKSGSPSGPVLGTLPVGFRPIRRINVPYISYVTSTLTNKLELLGLEANGQVVGDITGNSLTIDTSFRTT